MKPIDDATPPQTAAAAGAPGHTPGPWSRVQADEKITILGPREKATWLGRRGKWPVAEIPDLDLADGKEELRRMKANARLIAAAPDLLGALGSAPVLSKYHGVTGFDLDDFVHDYEAWMNQRRAAIAKATGAPQAASETSVTPTPEPKGEA